MIELLHNSILYKKKPTLRASISVTNGMTDHASYPILTAQ